MYGAQEFGIGKPYSERRFLSDGRLEVKSLGAGVHTDIYIPNASGEYWAGSAFIYRFVTDGMRLFLQKIR